jgi:hypothetical protein
LRFLRKEETMYTPKISTHRVITMLDREEMDFLDKLGKDALFTTGHKLSYNDILKGLIDVAKEARLSGDKINSLEGFKSKLIAQIKQMAQDDFKK